LHNVFNEDFSTGGEHEKDTYFCTNFFLPFNFYMHLCCILRRENEACYDILGIGMAFSIPESLQITQTTRLNL
jgi:hypothetical protein